MARADAALGKARAAYKGEMKQRAAVLGERALSEYEAALAAGPPGLGEPDDADLHHRAFLAAQYYLGPSDTAAKYRAVIRHIDGLRSADPLDPRGAELGLALCHAVGKLAAMGGADAGALFERGVEEYDAWFRRIDEPDPRLADSVAENSSNMAELLMALGRLDEAIAHYRRAIEIGAASRPALAWYGLAVAYDRNGQEVQARAAMRSAVSLDPDLESLLRADVDAESGVYFVPLGDRYYYLGLATQVLGRTLEARDYYMTYLREVEGGRKEYLESARRHIRELSGHVSTR